MCVPYVGFARSPDKCSLRALCWRMRGRLFASHARCAQHALTCVITRLFCSYAQLCCHFLEYFDCFRDFRVACANLMLRARFLRHSVFSFQVRKLCADFDDIRGRPVIFDQIAGLRLIVVGKAADEFDRGAVEGVDVDVVCLGHEYNEADSSFDVVCSVECFEHDPYAKETIHNMLRILKPGGLFYMSCAGVGRPEHGTEKTGESYGPHSSFYRNVSLNEMVSWMTSSSSDLSVLHVERSSAPEDLYCFGIKNESK